MKKNIVFLTVALIATCHLTAADYFDYPYACTEDTSILIPYESDKSLEGGFSLNIPTRNPEHIFKEAQKLIEVSETPQSDATRYYLSKRFADLQEKDDQYYNEIPLKYIHAINALRKDLHSQENIRRMVNALEQREDFSDAQKNSVLAIEKDMHVLPRGPRTFEKIKTIVRLLYPQAIAAAAVQVPVNTTALAQEEPARTKRKNATTTDQRKKPTSVSVPTPLPDASVRPKVSFQLGRAQAKSADQPTAKPTITFRPTAHQIEFQATAAEFEAMHGSKAAAAAKADGKVTAIDDKSSIAERMRRKSSALLNDI